MSKNCEQLGFDPATSRFVNMYETSANQVKVLTTKTLN